MTLLELYNNYYFHDNEVRLYCRFCDFMQSNYDDKDDSNSNIIVVFHNTVYKTNGNWEINEAGFINQRIEDNSIIFFMESFTDKVGELIIKASSVEITKVRTYNL